MRTLLLGCMGPALALLVAGCFPGSIPQARLGDRVWQDANSNGLQDQGEPGKEGVDVAIHKEDGELVAATLTDELGFYAFDQLRSGRYYLRFMVPEGWTITEKDAGDDELDSDVDPQSGQTEVFSFDSDTSDLTWDLGLMAAESQASGTAIAELVPTVEATSTPHPLAEYRDDPALQEAVVVIVQAEPDDSGVLRPNGSQVSNQLPENSPLLERWLLVVRDGEGNIIFGSLGPTDGFSMNVTGYAPGRSHPNWNFTVTGDPHGVAPEYTRNKVGPDDPGACYTDQVALFLAATTLVDFGSLGNLSNWLYVDQEDGNDQYLHVLYARNFMTVLAALLADPMQTSDLTSEGGPTVAAGYANQFFDPKFTAANSAAEAMLGSLNGGLAGFGGCLQTMLHAQ